MIIPDLPAVEVGDFLDAAGQAGLDATLMVTPATGQEQIKAIAGRTRGDHPVAWSVLGCGQATRV